MTDGDIHTLLFASVLIGALGGAFCIFRCAPKALMAVWALVFFFVPVWIGAQFGVFYSAITVITLLLIATSTVRNMQPSMVDVLLASFTLLLLAAWMLGFVTWGHILIALVGWMIPYVGGRLVSSRVGIDWIYACLAAGAVTASLLAIIEFITGVNIFVLLKMNNSGYGTWGPLQFRDGLLRVEGAFGHSIALGACLAMCSVFILVVRWPPWLRIGSLMIVMVATGLTFSRIGLIGLAVTLVCALLVLRGELTKSMRNAVVALTSMSGAIGVPMLLDVFSQAGDEASSSAEYRSDLLSLLHNISLLGISPSWKVLPNGESYYGSFGSIDSEFILVGLRFGLIPFLILIAALLCCILTAFGGRATPASLAIIGQIPAFATVALITQYASLVWFVAGLAVTSYAASSPSPSGELADTISSHRYREERAWLPTTPLVHRDLRA